MFRDEFDTVIYSNQKVKRYWNPLTNLYNVWEAKNKRILWRDVDYFELVGCSDVYHSRLLRIMYCINSEGYIVTKTGETVYTNKDIIELLGLQPSNRVAKEFIKFLYDRKFIKKDKLLRRIYMNPTLTMLQTKIHIDCYRVFRNELQDYLSARAIANLEHHLKQRYPELYKNVQKSTKKEPLRHF